jgi:hypothetical protein
MGCELVTFDGILQYWRGKIVGAFFARNFCMFGDQNLNIFETFIQSNLDIAYPVGTS